MADLHAADGDLSKVSSSVSPYQLHLVIIGAGLAGLSAAITTSLEGHRVTVLEKVSQLQEVGAGLQVTPNATRLLKRWGLFDGLRKRAAEPSSLTVRRYDGTAVLAQEHNFQEKMQERYDAPFWDLHRADLQRALVCRAIELGVEMRLDSEVVDIDFAKTNVRLKGGELVHGDVLLAADGLWSRSRSLFMQKDLLPNPTGDLAWRIILDLDDLKDPELVEWVSKPTVNFWIGPYAHVVGYSVKGGKQFNLVLLSPDDLGKDLSRAQGNLDEMKKLFAAWDPILIKFLDCVQSVDKWKLMHSPTLDNWRNEESNFVMAGDACHPMLPYLAQGANSSLEDGAVLGRLLGHVKVAADIPNAIKLYEDLRKERSRSIALETFKQREAFHMPDGEEQQQRDAIFAAALESGPVPSFSSRWTCPTFQPWLYGYDAYADADRAVSAVKPAVEGLMGQLASMMRRLIEGWHGFLRRLW
ncbi:FAD binding domain-containing protein [Microthyrium microscopicum]|uniref:FAD binding domain-containing protein n=1 Tax=Microthyrium microscopicum TaxID=703497 RepID=A0A6A6UW67_9PEZI|nr:FAD binding domain-containing protein [Microthyrium microscopicum]